MGKTHLAVALGIEAVRAGREVRFVDCARLVEDLEDASSRGILKKRLKYYAHSRLLIIDELGYLDIGKEGADLLFQLISTRYEQRSTIITANVGDRRLGAGCSGTTWRRARSRTGCATTATWSR